MGNPARTENKRSVGNPARTENKRSVGNPARTKQRYLVMEKDDLNQYVYYKRYLPHIQLKDSPIFITWRLSFKIPQPFILNCMEKKKQFDIAIRSKPEKEKEEQKQRFNKIIFDEYDILLAKDRSFPQILLNDCISNHIKYVLHYNDKELYDLFCYCIMPNHVHVLMKPLIQPDGKFFIVSDILRQWKGVSAKLINKEQNRSGNLWQHESYDHVVRNEKEFNNIVMYILNNPVMAGLADIWENWKDNYVSKEVMSFD